MAEYVIQPNKSGHYSVHKFEDGYLPTVTYVVSIRSRDHRLMCSCPAGTYRGYCKHTDFVKAYIEGARRDTSGMFMFSVED